MRHEIEVKLEVRDPRALKRRLSALGFGVIRARRRESNRLYDFADGRLRKAGWALRLRLVDGGCLLTLKSGAVASRSYKIRREIETEVRHGRHLSQILRMLGMYESFRYEKHRTIYGRKGSPESQHLAYDETPVGNYLELEGPRRWIDEIAGKLGYHREEFITVGYPTLYLTHQKREDGKRVRLPLSMRLVGEPDGSRRRSEL